MNVPSELRYTKSHEWVRTLPNNVVEIGLTDHAQEALGDLVFVNLPQEDDEVSTGETLADVESVKAVSDVYSPVSGRVIAVNEELLDAPQRINEDAYAAWMVRVELSAEPEGLLGAEEYEKAVEEEA
ncbi:glycine cleavage system protein GcvH [Beduinella massiliensis]|uniref:glycine cleavage system protein GcvH n=1 Tax=Beduinella massiliensis TaxID=1852363 RepID=UPI000C81ED34